MRFSTTLLAALPFLVSSAVATADDAFADAFPDAPVDTPADAPPVDADKMHDPLAAIKEPLQKALAKVVAYTGHPHRYDAAEAEAIRNGPTGMSVLTLHNWKDTLYEPVQARNPDITDPEEWWVFFTGGNKTCFGQCDQVTKAWNDSAVELRRLPGAPHLGFVNCEQQPVLCSAWGAGAGSIWSFELRPPPAEADVYRKRLNLTTTTTDDIIALWEAGSKEEWATDIGSFHPFKGWMAQKGVAVPFGYLMWGLNILPQWAFMLIVSMMSRTFM
jgi:hypothetical protein